MAAAWIAGASFNQLGTLFSIARQSAQQQVERIVPAHVRAQYIGRRMGLSFNRLGKMRDAFMRSPGEFGSEPERVAFLLREATSDED